MAAVMSGENALHINVLEFHKKETLKVCYIQGMYLLEYKSNIKLILI